MFGGRGGLVRTCRAEQEEVRFVSQGDCYRGLDVGEAAMIYEKTSYPT